MTAIWHRLTILLAENDENDLALIRRAFDRLRSLVRLIVVPDGELAIAYLQGEGKFANRDKWPLPDVLLLDQWMPGTSGLDVLCWLRAEPRLASLPVAVISGGLSESQAKMAGQLKAACCAKGAGTRETIEAIDAAMQSASGLARESWFASRTAYASPCSLRASEPEAIRVWT